MIEDRTPPQDNDAEQAVLGAMMLSRDAIADVVNIVRGPDFYRVTHEWIYDAIVGLYTSGQPTDPIAVAAALGPATLAKVGGAPYLHTLTAMVPVTVNAAYHANLVAEAAGHRRIIAVGEQTTQWGYARSGSYAALADRVQAALNAAGPRDRAEDYQRIQDLLPDTLDEIEALGQRGEVTQGIPTGFLDLDDLLGGFHPGQMVIVAGRPGLGKSTLAMDFLRAAAIHHHVPSVMFSLEMGRRELTMRVLSAEAKVPLANLRTGRVSEYEWGAVAAAAPRINTAPLWIDDSPNLTMTEIRAKARRLHHDQKVRFIVVDYMQLMSSGARVENRQVEVSEFSRQFKLLAKELGVPVVVLSQLNRGPEQRTSKRPMPSDLRESGCLTGDTTLLCADTGAPVTFTSLLRDGWDGVRVWAVQDGRMVPRALTNVFPSGTKPVHRLTLASGRTVTATANHQFFAWEGWTALGDLRSGDRLAIPRVTPQPETAGLGWSEDRLALLAYLIADGTVLPRHAVQVVDDDPAVLDTAIRAAREFGITARLDPGEASRCPIVFLPSPHHLTHGRRNPIQDWFLDLGIADLRSHQKRIPDALYAADNAEVAAFLRHLWATDGTVVVKSRTVRYDTTSPTLAQGVAALLARLGIVGRLRVIPQANGRDIHSVTVSGLVDIRRFASTIGGHGRTGERLTTLIDTTAHITPNTNVDTLPREVWQQVRDERAALGMSERKFQAAIGTNYCGTTLYKAAPGRERLERCADALDSPSLRAHATSDLFWDTIVEITPAGVEDVYDATVADAHNFIADGIIAHNSLEQDADIVMLLHREDAYEQESSRPGEADIIVAKHRNGPTRDVVVAAQLHFSRFANFAL